MIKIKGVKIKQYQPINIQADELYLDVKISNEYDKLIIFHLNN